jgi:hypothetical protein
MKYLIIYVVWRQFLAKLHFRNSFVLFGLFSVGLAAVSSFRPNRGNSSILERQRRFLIFPYGGTVKVSK